MNKTGLRSEAMKTRKNKTQRGTQDCRTSMMRSASTSSRFFLLHVLFAAMIRVCMVEKMHMNGVQSAANCFA